MIDYTHLPSFCRATCCRKKVRQNCIWSSLCKYVRIYQIVTIRWATCTDMLVLHASQTTLWKEILKRNNNTENNKKIGNKSTRNLKVRLVQQILYYFNHKSCSIFALLVSTKQNIITYNSLHCFFYSMRDAKVAK